MELESFIICPHSCEQSNDVASEDEFDARFEISEMNGESLGMVIMINKR